jgi:hypothetical protein
MLTACGHACSNIKESKNQLGTTDYQCLMKTESFTQQAAVYLRRILL